MCLLLFRYTANILNLFYVFDGNKNASAVFYRMNSNGIGAHYDYSPSLGRFLSRDPIQEQGGLNLYAFVKNAPEIFFGLWRRFGRCAAWRAFTNLWQKRLVIMRLI